MKRILVITLNLIGLPLLFFVSWAMYRALKVAYKDISFWETQKIGYEEWWFDFIRSFTS